MMGNMYENELYHHGVLGMSWGDRHGPPYPLQGENKDAARADAKKKLARDKALEKARKTAAKKRKAARIEKARAEAKALQKERREQKEVERAEKRARKDAKREMSIAQKKAELMAKGDLKEIKKNAKLFTNEELQYAIRRAEIIKNGGKELYTKEQAPSRSGLEMAADVAAAFAKIAVPVATVVTTMSAVQKYKQTKEMNMRDIKMKDLDIDIKELDKAAKESRGSKKIEDDLNNKLSKIDETIKNGRIKDKSSGKSGSVDASAFSSQWASMKVKDLPKMPKSKWANYNK